MEIHVNDLKCRTYTRAFLMLLIALGYANAGSPYIAESIPDSSYSSQYENFNGTVCRLHIKDSDGNDHIRVKADSDDTRIYFSFEPENGTNDVWINIRTKRDLDRETLGSTIHIKLIITDDQHNEIKFEHLVYILDVNDNSPVFQNLPYTFDIDELPCNKTIVYSNIRATDRDNGQNGTVTFFMKPKTQTAEFSNTFLMDSTTAAISLVKCLSFERNTYYHFVITAKDGGPNGGLTATTDLIIHVKDVQDKPPFFTGTYRKSIIGSIARGTGVIQVNAVDGDSGISNEISYSVLYSSCGDLFAIDNHTGVIYAATDVDMNTGKVSQQLGHCVLTIEASEIDMSYKKQYGYTTTSTNVTLILWDDTNNTLPIVGPACNHIRAQYTTTNTSPPTKMPLSCKEDWDFDNPCNKSNVLKGVTKFPHPDSIYKFLICDVSGKTFSAQCPKNEVFHADCSLCALPNQTFSKLCTISNKMFRNPCSKENIIAGNLTFPHPDSTNKYIRCDSRGNAWEEECFSGSFWDQTQMMCVLPEAFNPCHRRGSIVQTLYPHYCNPRLYVQCDNNGHPLVHMCQKDYVFLHYDLTCSPPAFPGTEYLRYTCN